MCRAICPGQLSICIVQLLPQAPSVTIPSHLPICQPSHRCKPLSSQPHPLTFEKAGYLLSPGVLGCPSLILPCWHVCWPRVV